MKRLLASDYAAVTEILGSSSLATTSLTPEDIPNFLGVVEGTSLVATGGLQTFGPAALLRSIATHPEYRNRGHASSIVEALESDARQKGVRTLYLLTDAAASFFERLGYRGQSRSDAPDAIAATHHFTRLCPDTASFMAKSIIS